MARYPDLSGAWTERHYANIRVLVILSRLRETMLDGTEVRNNHLQAATHITPLWALSPTFDTGTHVHHNAAERSLRTVALGRKNYLFASSDAGGERAAAIYSLIGSQAQRSRSRSVSSKRSVPHRRSSDQPHRGTPALEPQPRTCSVNVIRRQDGLQSTLTEFHGPKGELLSGKAALKAPKVVVHHTAVGRVKSALRRL